MKHRQIVNAVTATGLLVWVAATGARGQEVFPEDANETAQRFYQECVALARNSPSSGAFVAAEWRDRGGGIPALHCLALATFEQGKYVDAAEQLERLADDFRVEEGGVSGSRLSAFDRALMSEIYAQAGNAWLLADQPVRAYETFSAGIVEAPATSPTALELLVDRARASAALEDYPASIADLDRAQVLAPTRPDIYVYRATAHRHLEAFADANADIENALSHDPEHLGALLERGNLRVLSGNSDGARADWLAVISSDPESLLADAARANLEALDVDVESDTGADP